MQVNYHALWRFYKDGMAGAAVPTDDVICHVFTADYVAMKAMKYTGEGDRVPFLHRGMRAMKVADSVGDVLVKAHREFFRVNVFDHRHDRRELRDIALSQDCYIVVNEAFDAREEAKLAHKKNLYVVYPVPHYDRPDGIFFTADHFSFTINNGDDRDHGTSNHFNTSPGPRIAPTRGCNKLGCTERLVGYNNRETSRGGSGNEPVRAKCPDRGKKLHFHRTEYQPMSARPDRGTSPRINSHIPLEFVTREVGLLSPRMDVYSDLVWAVCERGAANANSISLDVVSGGGRRSRRRAVGDVAVEDFASLWRRAPVNKIEVFGVWNALNASNAQYDVTIFVTSRLRSQMDRPRLCFKTHLSQAAMRNETRVQEAVAKCLSGWTWDDFAT